MREMALLATTNGDSDPKIYGGDPNNGNTWDADRIYGCICDEGYTGFDCSQRSCKYGDDPNTYGQVNEVQLFECAGTAGTLTFSFRQKTTYPIPYNATRQELEAALEWLTNIGDVIVLFSSGNSTCTDIGLSQCGNQPVRQADLEVLFTILAASTQCESAWRPRTRRLRLTHPNV